MLKKQIFRHVSGLPFSEDGALLVELVGKHLDRIEFVKDYVGLPDVLFIAESDAVNFLFPLFACFGVNVVPENRNHNIVAAHEAMVEEPSRVREEVLRLLRETDRTLYVSIGFKESFLTNEDKFRIYQSLEENVFSDSYEAMTRVRRFPDWYAAKFPNEIEEERKYLEILENYEDRMRSLWKEELIAKIDESLSNNDLAAFLDLSEMYGKVCGEAN